MSEPGAVLEAEAVVGPARERARVLTLRYLVASSAIFLAAGVLGVLLRTSQSDLGRLDSNFFYAMMTAHGLGAFVGWAAFAVMGLSWWMLALVDYVLIPRYANRPLVAGNVVAVAWVLAVFVNLMIWAHHIYLDYPSGSVQAGIDTAMQPLTFAITIPSALSIYSLFFTSTARTSSGRRHRPPSSWES